MKGTIYPIANAIVTGIEILRPIVVRIIPRVAINGIVNLIHEVLQEGRIVKGGAEEFLPV